MGPKRPVVLFRGLPDAAGMGYTATEETQVVRTYVVQLERYIDGSIYGTFSVVVNAPTKDDAISLAKYRMLEGKPRDMRITFHVLDVTVEQ